MSKHIFKAALPDIIERNIYKEVKALRGKTVLLYGAGAFGTEMYYHLKKAGIEVTSFLDRNVTSDSLSLEVPVFTAENAPFDREQSVVLFCIVMDYQERRNVISWLQEMGYCNIIEAQFLRCLFVQPDDMRSGELLSDYYCRRLSDIDCAATLFQEDFSRRLYENNVLAHMTCDYSGCEQYESALHDQYFPDDIPIDKGYARFVDCGGYIGDTTERLIERKHWVNACAVFEPDSKNFQRMRRRVGEKKKWIGAGWFFPCAVSSGTKQRAFECGTGSGTLCEGGSEIVQTVALDEAIPDFQPTFIKMDIEGAELDALRGAKELIVKNRPDLAVCVYHAVNHIWDIPLLIDSWKLGYNFFLRSYSAYTLETVMYAITKEKGDIKVEC